ncbi:MAG TPA: hypothetical protein VLD37_04380 [Candidatus Bilamarchaeum sp.]|nr:hypothetical protein [Candidatus Bilamarchaeum sp.]
MAPQNSSAGDAKASSADREKLEALEAQALETVKKSISAIEEAMAAYEGAAKKPEELAKRYESYKKTHAFLTKWAREYLLEYGKMTFAQRMERLQKLEFFLMYGDG